jgi:hypothetical protein
MAWHRRHEVRLGHDSQREQEVGDSRGDPSDTPEPLERDIDVAMRVARRGNQHMLGRAVPVERELGLERVSTSHRDRELFIVEGRGLEPRWNLRERLNHEVSSAPVEVAESVLRQQLAHAEIDERAPRSERLQQRR